MICPECQAENDDAAEVCFSCRAVLSAVTRGSLIASRYEVVSSLGKGGMGTVYKAHDRVLDEPVAIKLLRSEVAGDAEMARRFRSEIKLARKVSHKNVCRIHEYGEDKGLRYISMEYIDGVDLKQFVRQRGGLPPREAFEVAIQLAQGLEAIHDVGIIHRDLKTPNVMRDTRGVVRLMDFGIAKLSGADATSGGTATGQVMGTPEYMSPEQARGQKVDFRTDIYALGVVIYEIFTGQVPFKGDTPVATLFMHVQDPPPLTGVKGARIPAPLVPVLSKALAKHPTERFASAKEMAEALHRASAAAGSHSAVSAATIGLPELALPEESKDSASGAMPTAAAASLPTVGLATAGTPGRVAVAPPRASVASGPKGRVAEEKPRSARAASRPQPWPEGRGRGLLLAALAVAVGVGVLLTQWDALVPPPVSHPTMAPSVPPPPVSAATLAPEAEVADPSTLPASGRLVADPNPRSPASPPVSSRPAPSPRPTSMSRPASPRASSALTVAPPPPTIPAASQTVAEPTPLPAPAPPATPPSALPAAATPLATPIPVPAAPLVTPTTAPAAAPVEQGVLQLVVVPFADTTVDETSLGRVSSSKFPLAPGGHVIVLSHPDYQPLRRKITIVPGETLKLVVDLAEEAVRKKK